MRLSNEFILILVSFWALVIWTLTDKSRRKKLFTRGPAQWTVDLVGLTMHGSLVPLFQSVLIFGALLFLAPGSKGRLDIPFLPSFLLSFIVIDYFYYWNHRLLHSESLWRFHALHHSGNTLDVFATSRNTLWTTFLILYVWANGILLYLLKDPAGFGLGIALTNAFDILRHANFQGWPEIVPFSWIISPREHAWHHSQEKSGVNFGGNLNLWDRLHGTYFSSEKLPVRTGFSLETDLWSAFWKGTSEIQRGEL